MELPWKGNVRELENALTRAVILAKGDIILKENLPLETVDENVIRRELVPLKDVEKSYIQYVLNMAKGNKTRTCQILQISRPTLDKKIREYKLEVASSAIL
jgi:two-component system, NtrC family, response regulator HydG